MTPRKRLGTTGERGKSLVRLFLETKGKARRYVVQWGPSGARQQDSWPATPAGKTEAETFFKAFGDEAAKGPEAASLTVRGLWLTYLEAEAEHLRPRSRLLYAESWTKWEQFIGPETRADAVTLLQIATFRKQLDAQGLATATVKSIITNVRVVYNFAERSELIARNRWHLFQYKIAKERRTKPRAEYRSEEFLAIWRALDPTLRGQWRAWVAVGLLGIYGNRQGELLQLQWSWIQGDHVAIDPAVVKTGEEGTWTLFPLARSILDVARDWARKEGYTGPYVLFAGQAAGRKHPSQQAYYSIQTLTNHLHRAEARAGVPQIRWRAGHGFRRGLVGDLADSTGDVMLALQAIGDRDVRMAKNYRVRRNDKVAQAVEGRATRLMSSESATKLQSDPPTHPSDAS